MCSKRKWHNKSVVSGHICCLNGQNKSQLVRFSKNMQLNVSVKRVSIHRSEVWYNVLQIVIDGGVE